MAIASVFTGLGGIAVFLIPPDNMMLVLVSYLVFGFASGASQLFPRAIMADIVDENTAMSGETNTGLYFSFLTTTLKLGLALGVGISFGLADLAGFDPAAARLSNDAHWVIRAIMGSGSIILSILIAALMWNFPLDRSKQEALRQQIAAG